MGWRWRSKKQRSRTTIESNCKDKVKLCNSLLVALSSMLTTYHKSKGHNSTAAKMVSVLSEERKSDKC